MFDRIFDAYVKYVAVRLLYQIGFVIAWAFWASKSLLNHEATWLVFGWLPAVFWPVELVARSLSWLPSLARWFGLAA